MTTIRDIMNHRVAVVRAEATLAEAVQTLVDNHIGGAPVVSADGAVVGIISETDLIDVLFELNVRHAPVSKYMTRNVKVLTPDAPLFRAARLFALSSFRRLPVVDNGKLVGIVSRRDLLNHALKTQEMLTEPLMELIPSLAQLS